MVALFVPKNHHAKHISQPAIPTVAEQNQAAAQTLLKFAQTRSPSNITPISTGCAGARVVGKRLQFIGAPYARERVSDFGCILLLNTGNRTQGCLEGIIAIKSGKIIGSQFRKTLHVACKTLPGYDASAA